MNNGCFKLTLGGCFTVYPLRGAALYTPNLMGTLIGAFPGCGCGENLSLETDHHSGSGLGDGALAEEDAFPAPCGGPSLWPASSESIIWYLERPEAGFDSWDCTALQRRTPLQRSPIRVGANGKPNTTSQCSTLKLRVIHSFQLHVSTRKSVWNA